MVTHPSLPHLRRDALYGMGLAALCFALLSGMDTIFKLMALAGHPTCQIMFINAGFALLPILAWTKYTGGTRGIMTRLATTRLPQHLARGGTSVLSTFAAVFAYSRLPLTDFYAIIFAGPLVITAMGAFWLGETVDRQRSLAILAGFLGILVVINPLASPLLQPHHAALNAQQSAAMLGRFAAFISMFCYALSVIIIRRMRGGESAMSFSFYGYFVSMVICGTLCLFRDTPALSWGDIAHLALSGSMGGIASICMMTAYHRSPVALVAPFQYTQIIWGAVAGYFIWNHVPSHHLLLGAAIVAGSGVYVIHREVRGRRPEAGGQGKNLLHATDKPQDSPAPCL